MPNTKVREGEKDARKTTMRTLLIAPSFLAVFAAVLVSLGWLIASSDGGPSPNFGALPPRGSFAAWHETMPAQRPFVDPATAAARERMNELGQF
jgi:hypothetical protein